MFSARSIAPMLAIGFKLICLDSVFGQGPPSGVSGKWVGVLDIVHADGSVQPDQAFLSLAVDDHGTISGTAGNTRDHQAPISTGKAARDKVAFEIQLGPGKAVSFDLSRDGDHMHGKASGLPADDGSEIVVDVRRANAEWQVSEEVKHAPDRLFETIAALDEKLFNAYNHCDLPTMAGLVAEDLEFYHDKTGLAVGRELFLESIRTNICGKTQRELIPGSMEVHRLDHYGAVEIGRHRFRHPGDEQLGVGEAKFITLWRYKDGKWLITREISYDHGAAEPGTAK